MLTDALALTACTSQSGARGTQTGAAGAPAQPRAAGAVTVASGYDIINDAAAVDSRTGRIYVAWAAEFG